MLNRACSISMEFAVVLVAESQTRDSINSGGRAGRCAAPPCRVATDIELVPGPAQIRQQLLEMTGEEALDVDLVDRADRLDRVLPDRPHVHRREADLHEAFYIDRAELAVFDSVLDDAPDQSHLRAARLLLEEAG